MNNKREGFSIVECLVGMFVLMVITLTSSGFLLNFTKANVSLKDVSQATTIGTTAMEKLRSLSYNILTNGCDTIDNKFKCSWLVSTQSAMKVINLTVQWPLSPKKSEINHSIQLSTIKAQ